MPAVARTATVVVVFAVLSTVVAVAAPAAPAGAAPRAPVHRAPVDAPVVDPFRPGPRPWSPQNLGLEYGTPPDVPVRATAAGTVTFAGRTPSGSWVTVAHADGLRTSYGPLATVAVRAGQAVPARAVLGTTAGRLHLGVRLGDVYLDPALVLAGWAPDVRLRLVPAPLRPGIDDELARQRLAALGGGLTLGGIVAGGGRLVLQGGRVVGVLGGMVRDAVAEHVWSTASYLVALADIVWSLEEVHSGIGFLRALAEWWDQRDECTPSGTPVPPPGPERAEHIVVLVAGFHSRGALGAAVDDVDVAALGYDPARVARFSYAGGIVPDPADGPVFDGVAVRDYGPEHADQSLDHSAAALRELLGELARRHPGVPVDVIAHSQGGVVAVRAIQDRGAGPPLPTDLSVVTIAAPHAGSTVAGAAGLVADGPGLVGGPLAEVLDGYGAPSPQSPAARDLRPTSAFMRDYHAHDLPEGVDVTVVAGRTDPVVPTPDTRLAGATRVVVDSGAAPHEAHERLPGQASTTREIGLALAGLDPTCRGLADALVDWGVGTAFAYTTNRLAMAASVL